MCTSYHGYLPMPPKSRPTWQGRDLYPTKGQHLEKSATGVACIESASEIRENLEQSWSGQGWLVQTHPSRCKLVLFIIHSSPLIQHCNSTISSSVWDAPKEFRFLQVTVVFRVFLYLYCLALPESHRFFGILLTLDMMYFIFAKLLVKGMRGPVLEGAPYLSSLHSQPLLKFWSRLEPTSQLLNFSLLGIFLSMPVESLNASSLELPLQSCSIFFSEKYRRQPCQQ